MFAHKLTSLSLLLCVASHAVAQEGDRAKTDPDRQALAGAPATPSSASSARPTFPPFSKVTKGLKSQQGLFNLYADAKKLKGFIEIPARMMKRPFLMAQSFAGGTTYTGWQWSDALVYWQVQDKQLMLIQKNVRYRAKGVAVEDAVKRTYTDSLILSLPIASKSTKGGYLVSLGSLFAARAGTFFGDAGSSLDARLAVFSKLKAFPSNVEIAVTMPPRGGGAFVTVHYSLRDLGRSPYKPRAADDRIGYFLTVVKDFKAGRHDDGRFLRFCNRWDLTKLDPKLAMSPVKKPIVFYLEKSIPIAYRRYVAAGVLAWREAFEKVGFLDAIQARQQTKDNEFKDFDPEDARYNFFRWITSESAFAMGPSRVNPMTGEILDADIIFDDSMISSSLVGYERLIASREARPTSRLEALLTGAEQSGARALMEWLRPEGSRPLSSFDQKLTEQFVSKARRDGHSVCLFGRQKLHEMNFARLALAGKGGVLPLDFIGQTIKETVMHEVGHTLGLRHNFAASSWKPMADINKAERPAVTVASVMDYNPVNVVAPGATQGQFITQGLGPYDFWAIEYGYGGKGDAASLAAIAARSAEPGHEFATDEDTGGPDPYVNRWDLGANPLDYARGRVALARGMLPLIETRSLEKGRGYAPLRAAFGSLLYEYESAAGLAARFVGGIRIHRDHFGDAGARDPIEPVAPAQQRAALSFVLNEICGAGRFEFEPALLRRLGSSHWSHWGSGGGSGSSYPVERRVAGIQSRALSRVMGNATLGRLFETAYQAKQGEKVLTVAELFSTSTASITSELDTPVKGAERAARPVISSLRRELHRAYVAKLIELSIGGAGGAPRGAQTLAWSELGVVKKRIDDFLEKSDAAALDVLTRAHLEETRTRIQKALDAAYQIGGGGGGGGNIIIMIGKDGRRRRVTPPSPPQGAPR